MMTDEEFEDAIDEALDEIPDEFHEKIENLDIIVEDYPSLEVQRQMGASRNGLLGLYTGVPQKHRSPTWYGSVLPDRIYLYKKNIEAISRDREELKHQIQSTVLHEIGHYFGIDDKRLRELGF